MGIANPKADVVGCRVTKLEKGSVKATSEVTLTSPTSKESAALDSSSIKDNFNEDAAYQASGLQMKKSGIQVKGA